MEKTSREKYNGLEITLYNLDKLNLNFRKFWQIGNVNKDLKTVEERHKIIEKEKKLILEKKDLQFKEIIEERKNNYFLMLKRGISHIVYIILYVETFKLQIPYREVKIFIYFYLFLFKIF